jgi:fatty acid desaturase
MAVATGRGMRLTAHTVDRLHHVLRLAACAALLAAAGRLHCLPAMIAAAAALWLAAFATAHDLVHNALGLGRRAGEAALTVAGWILVTSGQAMRVSHLWHHKRPLADDDYEGVAAHGAFARALACAPWWMLAQRLHAFRLAGARIQRRQLTEHALLAALVGAAWAAGLPALRVYLVVALAAHLSAPIVAGRIPHRAPAWLLAVAAAVGRTGSPTALALAYHERHHRQPHVPCARLADA